jgi:hypothetical protein
VLRQHLVRPGRRATLKTSGATDDVMTLDQFLKKFSTPTRSNAGGSRSQVPGCRQGEWI